MDDYCHNHQTQKAINKCCVCQNYYCDSCLIEVAKYYYCKRSECIKVLKEKLMPSEITCPSCKSEISLELGERIDKKFHCPNCEKYIDMNYNPVKILDPKKYNYLITTMNQADIALIKSILNSEKIDYFIFGHNFLSLDPMIQGAKLYVYEDHYQMAQELVNELDLHVFGGSARNK